MSPQDPHTLFANVSYYLWGGRKFAWTHSALEHIKDIVNIVEEQFFFFYFDVCVV